MKDELVDQLLELARTTEYGLSAYLTEVVDSFLIDGTQTCLRTFLVNLDEKGQPRINDLHRALARHVLDYAIPRSKILEAKKEFDETGSSAKLIGLSNQARELFVDLDKTGEGGELLLFTFCEQILALPLVIAKMNIKTDTQMHFHGADGVYAGLNDKGFLTLFWGESKIYNDRSKAAADCFDSLSKLLITDGGEDTEVERDLELLRDYSDLGDKTLTKQFQQWLIKDNPDFNDVEFRAVCLIGFDDASYPKELHQKNTDELLELIKVKVDAYKDTISHYVNKTKLEKFELISICLPIPSSEEFRKQFLKCILNK